MPKTTKSSFLFAIVVIAFAITTIFVVSKLRASRSLADFSAYWTACDLFTDNPFDETAVGAIQQDQAMSNRGTLVMRNPPWTALVFFPYSFFSYQTATALWIVTSILLVFASSLVFWRELGGTDHLIGLVITFAFAPTFVLFDLGQITALLLAGAALFLYAIQRRKDWIAGLALVPFTFKPHISLLFMLALCAWVMVNRRWRVLGSLTAALITMMVACFALNPKIFQQYFTFAQQVLNLDWVYPNVSGALHEATGIQGARYLPLLGGLAFITWRLQHLARWDWIRELPLLLTVGVATSFYSYIYDEVLAVPLMFTAFLDGERKWFVALFAITNGLIYFYMRMPVIGNWWWTCLAWFAVYWLCLWMRRYKSRTATAV